MIDWRHWHNEPILIGGLLLLGWLYAIATGPLRERFAPGASYPRRAAFRFYGALLVFYFAVGSPLDQIGERFLLCAHMVQHQLLIYVSAVLFLTGLPEWLVRPLTSPPRLRAVLRCVLNPIACGLIYILVLSIWHAPRLYDWALQDKNVHVIEHIMFFGAALLYWWPILSPSRELPATSAPMQMVYLLAVTIGMTPVFAFIAFSDNVLYPTYEYAPRLFANLPPSEDQMLGAAIMKLGDMAVTVTAMTLAFYRWHRSDENSKPAMPHSNDTLVTRR